MKAKGVQVLAPSFYSPLMLLAHKAVRTAADLQGQKIRTQGGAPIQVDPLKKLGVIPVSLPLGEALPAMQNKTIDGMVGAAAPYVAFKYYDIAKPMTYLPSTMFAAPVVINRGWLKSLGPDLEKIVENPQSRGGIRRVGHQRHQKQGRRLKKNGGEVVAICRRSLNATSILSPRSQRRFSQPTLRSKRTTRRY